MGSPETNKPVRTAKTPRIVSKKHATLQGFRNATDEDVAKLRTNQARMTRATQTRDDRAVVRLDLEYHSIISEATKNPALALAQEPIGILLYSGLEALLPHLPQAPARQLEAHGRVIDAVAAGDPDVARDWTLRHAVDFRRGYLMAGLPMDAPIAPLVPAAGKPAVHPIPPRDA